MIEFAELDAHNSVRELLGLFDAERRGYRIVQMIREALDVNDYP
jgi:hypothetical protein